MRTYLSLENLKKALPLGAVMTMLSVPRIVVGGMDPAIAIPGALASLTLMAGGATAWSTRAGMVGLFPPRNRTLIALAVAAGLVALFLPVYCLWIDPRFRTAVETLSDPSVRSLRYPPTLEGRIALVLWTAGFETLFLYVAAMAFICRIVNRIWLAIIIIAALRLLLTFHQFARCGLSDDLCLYLFATAVVAAVSCVLFARGGLLPVMFFSAGLSAHVFF